jgi:DNA-binding beta-propeller fold protein YncE
VAVVPDGARAYVTNSANGNVSVIDTTTNTRGRHRRGRERPLGGGYHARRHPGIRDELQ